MELIDPFTNIPEDFVSEILSRTSPLDASRVASISKLFKSAADSDAVWDKFLPLDCLQIISTSVSPVIYATKKQLYLTLCHFPIVIDAGKLSFSLEKCTGKKCYMVGARELAICWGDTSRYWKWTSCADSRFSEVAKLKSVCWLDIRGKIKTQKLSSKTNYGAYLVFKLAERFYGLESVNAVIRFINDETDGDAERRAGVLHLHRGNGSRLQTGEFPVRRDDGWMEIQMGSFYNDEGDDGEVEARLIEIARLDGKRGLIVEGIEFRPKPHFVS